MRRLQLSILCITVFMTSSLSSPTDAQDHQIIDDDRDFDPDSCYDETRNVTMKKGEAKQREGKCSALACTGSTINDGEVISNYVNQECSKKETKLGCTVIPGNMSEPFPKCCPQVKCRKETTPMTEKCLDPATSQEVKKGEKVKAPDGECAVYECVGAERNSTSGMYSSRLFKHRCKTYKLKPFCFFEPGVQGAPYPFCCPRELCLSDTARKPVHSVYRRSPEIETNISESESGSLSSFFSLKESMTATDGDILVTQNLSASSAAASEGANNPFLAVNDAQKYSQSRKRGPADLNASSNSSRSAASSSTASKNVVVTPDGGKIERKKSSSSSTSSAETSTSVKKKGKRRGRLNSARTLTFPSTQEKNSGSKGSIAMNKESSFESSTSNKDLIHPKMENPSPRRATDINSTISASNSTSSSSDASSKNTSTKEKPDGTFEINASSSDASAKDAASTSYIRSAIVGGDGSSSNTSSSTATDVQSTASSLNNTSVDVEPDGSSTNSSSSAVSNAESSAASSSKTLVETDADGTTLNSTSSVAAMAKSAASSLKKNSAEVDADGSSLNTTSSVASTADKSASSSNHASVEVNADGTSLNSASSSSATVDSAVSSSNSTSVGVSAAGISSNITSSMVVAAKSAASSSMEEIVQVGGDGQPVHSSQSSAASSQNLVTSSNSNSVSISLGR